MATRIGSAFFDVTFNTAAARREVTALVSTANRQFGLLGGIGIVAATIGIGAVTRSTIEMGNAAVTAANEYETAFTNVRKTLDTAGLDAEQAERTFGRLSEELRDLALITPLDLEDDLTAVAALGGQLGIAAEDIKEFTQVISEVGVTTNVAVEDAAISFARVANIMGIPESQFRQFGDTLIHLGNNLATREDEILNFSLRIAAAGDIAGFTSDEVLALSASMSAVGVPAERGGTAVQRVLIEITESVANADDRLRTFAQLAGMTSEQFATAWETNAGGAFVDFVEGLGAAGTEAFSILQDLELGNLRTVQSFLSLANAGPLLRNSFELAGDSAEALRTEADLFFGTTESNIQLLANAVNDAGIRMGEPIQGPFNDVIDSIREWIAVNPVLIEQIGTNLATALENLEGPLIRAIDLAVNFVETFSEFLASDITADFMEDSTSFLQRGFAFDPHLAGFREELDNLFRDAEGWTEILRIGLGPLPDIFGALVDAQLGALTLVEEDLRQALEGGADPVVALVDAFIDLEERLEPLGGKITDLGFRELVNEINLTEEELKELIDLLIRAGVDLPGSVLPQSLVPGGVPGHPEFPRAIITPQTDAFTQIQRDLLSFEDEAELAEAQAAAFADALTGVRDAADDLGLPISVLLDNMRLLPPEVAEAVREFGAAEVEARLFAESLQGLEDALEFDTGVAITQIDLLTGAVEEGNTSITEMQTNAEEALNQLAEFEAGKAILEALGLDQLVTAVEDMDFGTAIHAVQDLIDDLPRAFELEATLDTGGTLSEDMESQLAAALATVDLTPELLDMAGQFSSNEVQQIIIDAAREQGLEYGATLGSPDVTGAIRDSGVTGGVEFGAGMQSSLDQLGLSVEVALELGVIDPTLAAILTHSGASIDIPNTRVPPNVEVNIQSSGTTAGDAARAGQAVNNVISVE